MEPENTNFDLGGRRERSVNTTYSMDERTSWGEMAERLYDDLARLYQNENQLMRTEFREKVGELKVATSSLIIGGSLLFVGIFAAVATAIIALDIVLPLWASALIVAAFLLVVGGIMFSAAKKKLNVNRLTPQHSINTLGEIRSTVKERINEFKTHH